MPSTVLAISQRLADDVRTLDAISQNVANLSTPGYRGVRTIPRFDPTQPSNTSANLRDGGLSQTARPLDLALQGEGFFTVARGTQVLLVRAGQFRVDAEGYLATPAGERVLGTSGPIEIPAGDVHVDADGTLRMQSRLIGQLQLVNVAAADQLRPAGGGAYSFDGSVVPAKAVVVQGALERANVEPADEMIHLMETVRHAESLQRALSTYDKAMESGINKLGDN